MDEAGLLQPADDKARALLARWQGQGDVEALDELLRGEVHELARRLRARAGRAFDGALSASDLAQEAVLRLLRLDEPPAFDDPRALRAYLWTAAWRLLANRLASPAHALVRLSHDQTASLSGVCAHSGGLGALERDDQQRALELVVNLLRPEDQECLSLVYFQGLSIEAAAQRAGVTRATLDVRLTRARRRLAERLVDWSDAVG